MWNDELSAELEACSRDVKLRPLTITRVGQLDALMLDTEIKNLLDEQLEGIVKQAPGGEDVLINNRPEIQAVLGFFIWYFSVRINAPTPGMALLNLRFRNELKFTGSRKSLTSLFNDTPTRFQRLLYLLGTVFAPWVWARAPRLELIKVEKVWVACNLINFLLFLKTGKFRSILTRVLGMRLVYDKPEATRSVSFDFINQQLLYDGFSEMLLCMLPLIEWNRFKRIGYSILRVFSSSTKNVDTRGCAFCGRENACVPYRTNCGHVYCYYCIKSQQHPYNCAACNETIVSSNVI